MAKQFKSKEQEELFLKIKEIPNNISFCLEDLEQSNISESLITNAE